jgi:2,4-dienoyl-CoA reductase-like NADH-dependent reductase (Old Yellow Enzyme family)
MNSVLFQPFRLHDLTLKNRIALSPMTRSRAGTARLANRLMAEYYAQRSSAGLLITEGVTISDVRLVLAHGGEGLYGFPSLRTGIRPRCEGLVGQRMTSVRSARGCRPR